MKNERCVDLIEVLPGLMPKVIHRVAATCGKPIIAGGLVTEKADVVNALEAGALAVSSTNPGFGRCKIMYKCSLSFFAYCQRQFFCVILKLL